MFGITLAAYERQSLYAEQRMHALLQAWLATHPGAILHPGVGYEHPSTGEWLLL